MKINIVKRVDIEITQDDLEEMILDKIKAADPSIQVDGFEFIQKRNPTRIEVEVDAYFGDKKVVKEETTVEPQTEDDVEEVVTTSEPVKEDDVASIFGVPS